MSRYHKKIQTDKDGNIDLYAIAEAFGVKANAQFHAFKKTLMAGQRGDKGLLQDIDEAIQALQRWKEMEQQKLVTPTQFNCPPLCSKCHKLHAVGECPSDGPKPCPVCGVVGCRTLHRLFVAGTHCPVCGHGNRECMCKKPCDCGCLSCAKCYPEVT